MNSSEEERAKQRERVKRWRKANPDKQRAINKRYYENNKAKCAAKAKAWNSRNPNYATEQSRRWRAANPDKIKCKSLRRSGFTLALKRQKLKEQDNRCAICGSDFSVLKEMHVHADHCHTSGTPRGILCKNCNTGLGAFLDNPALLLKAAQYLENFNVG